MDTNAPVAGRVCLIEAIDLPHHGVNRTAGEIVAIDVQTNLLIGCLLYTSDAADE